MGFSPGKYLIGSLGYVAVPLILVLAVMRPSAAALRDILVPQTRPRRLAAAAFWWPLLLPIPAAMLFDFNITPLWSMSAWTLLPIIMLSSPLTRIHRATMLTVVALAIALPPTMVVTAPAIAEVIFHDGRSGSFYLRPLAERIALEWRNMTDKPLRTVIGDEDLTYGTAYYLHGRANGYPSFVASIKLDTLLDEGFIAVCRKHSVCLQQTLAAGYNGHPMDIEITPRFLSAARSPERFTVVIVPPKK